MTEQNHAASIIDTATLAAKPNPIDTDKPVHSLTLPAGGTLKLVETERFQPKPYAKRGTVHLQDADSLIDYVELHTTNETTIWIDQHKAAVVSVLDDHTSTDPHWGEHRAVLQLRRTSEWQRWLEHSGQLRGQVEFAEHIEESLLDIYEPVGADLLEIAQTFHASVGGAFKQAHRLDSGAVQLEYTEEITAKAGRGGQAEIPATFALQIAPFIGEEAVQVVARIRYRVNSGQLRIGYTLERPDDVERDCITRLRERLTSKFNRVYAGTPRDARA